MRQEKFDIGLSVNKRLTRGLIADLDYLEVKVITREEVRRIRDLTDKPLFFHIQYTGDGGHLLPTAMDFDPYLDGISAAVDEGKPKCLSVHFGLSSPRVRMDDRDYVAVADTPPLGKEEIVRLLEKNLKALKAAFPRTPLLIENVEFVPEAVSRGAYRHVQEASFFGSHVTRLHGMGLLDGAILDVSHAVIASGNHPYYNGLGGDPVDTGEAYIEKLKGKDDIFTYYEGYISLLPLHLVREIHLSGPRRLPSGMWVDSHEEIGDFELGALKILLEALKKKGVEYLPVTLEYARDMKRVPPQLAALSNFLRSIS